MGFQAIDSPSKAIACFAAFQTRAFSPEAALGEGLGVGAESQGGDRGSVAAQRETLSARARVVEPHSLVGPGAGQQKAGGIEGQDGDRAAMPRADGVGFVGAAAKRTVWSALPETISPPLGLRATQER